MRHAQYSSCGANQYSICGARNALSTVLPRPHLGSAAARHNYELTLMHGASDVRVLRAPPTKHEWSSPPAEAILDSVVRRGCSEAVLSSVTVSVLRGRSSCLGDFRGISLSSSHVVNLRMLLSRS